MTIRSALRTIAIASLTPLLEKDVSKTYALHGPAVFSMSRVIVLAFAAGVLRQIWHAGIAGWPEATLAIAIVLALPVLGALERATTEQVMNMTATLLEQFGVGACGPAHGELPATATREPSRSDDLRTD